MAQVSLDKLLSLVGTKRPAITDRIVIRRNGLVKRIGEQIDVLENIIAYQPVAKLPKSTMKWWWQDGARYYVAVYYARAPLELAKGKYSAQCVDLPAVVNALKAICESVLRGEFDENIRIIAGEVRVTGIEPLYLINTGPSCFC
jgi:hypothetical protein